VCNHDGAAAQALLGSMPVFEGLEPAARATSVAGLVLPQ
jgi:hypothetical protein